MYYFNFLSRKVKKLGCTQLLVRSLNIISKKAKNTHSIVGCSNRDTTPRYLLLLMYNDFDNREWWVQVLEVAWLGFGRLVTEILTNVVASDFIIENGKRI